jgi:signal transduction histidine kinase
MKLPCFKIFLIVLLSLMATDAFAQTQKSIDSLKKLLTTTSKEYVRNCFLIADNFMDIDYYDSAQLWLNRIAERLPLKKPSLFNYFLSTRQAEVYYYNGLQRLGLQESERSLSIAQSLNDSLLLADSYNFIGLFYVNLDSAQKAIPYFRKGIRYAKQPPYPSRYLSLSNPHHLYGNIAEAFVNTGHYDSSIYYSRISSTLAAQIGLKRGIGVAQNNLGVSFFKLNQTDSALYYFLLSIKTAQAGGDFDIELLNYGDLARIYDLLNQKAEAVGSLEKGFHLIASKPEVNDLFRGQFLDNAILLFKKYGAQAQLVEALQLKAQLLQQQTANNNRQINAVLNAGLQNETRLLNLEIKEAKQRNEIANTRVYLLLSLIVLLGTGFILYRYKIKQQLQIVQLQNKISQDLHDDVGSSLSSLQVYSTVAEKLIDQRPSEAKEMLKKISKESSTVMENIGDIVWSIKTVREQSLEERIKNFVADVLGAAGINYSVFIEEGIENNIKNIEARKNILLIIKEAVNNTMKYSKASNVSVSIKKMVGHLCIQVTDDGVGFDHTGQYKKGIGLSGMEKRTVDLDGIYELITKPGKGTTVSALFPLTKISESY